MRPRAIVDSARFYLSCTELGETRIGASSIARLYGQCPSKSWRHRILGRSRRSGARSIRYGFDLSSAFTRWGVGMTSRGYASTVFWRTPVSHQRIRQLGERNAIASATRSTDACGAIQLLQRMLNSNRRPSADRDIAGQRAHHRQRPGLRVEIPLGGRSLHARADRSVDAGDRQRLKEQIEVR